jgi:hypothetical protein
MDLSPFIGDKESKCHRCGAYFSQSVWGGSHQCPNCNRDEINRNERQEELERISNANYLRQQLLTVASNLSQTYQAAVNLQSQINQTSTNVNQTTNANWVGLENEELIDELNECKAELLALEEAYDQGYNINTEIADFHYYLEEDGGRSFETFASIITSDTYALLLEKGFEDRMKSIPYDRATEEYLAEQAYLAGNHPEYHKSFQIEHLSNGILYTLVRNPQLTFKPMKKNGVYKADVINKPFENLILFMSYYQGVWDYMYENNMQMHFTRSADPELKNIFKKRNELGMKEFKSEDSAG